MRHIEQHRNCSKKTIIKEYYMITTKSSFNKLGSFITNTMMTLIVASSHIAYAIGGQDGGGTTGSYNNSGQLVSYDILSKDPNFKDDQQVPNIILETNLTGFIKNR